MSLKEKNLESAVSIITKLGLTNLQAKAYLGLVQLGGGSASEAAKAANINRAEIYRIMRELQKHGIVEYSISAPKKFIPIPPEKAVNRLIEKKKTIIHEIENEKNNLINRLNTTKMKIEKEYAIFHIITDDRKILREKVIELIVNAESSLSVITHSHIGHLIGVREALDRNVQRVKTKFITDVTTESLSEIEKFKNYVQIRHYAEINLHLIIADDDRACLSFLLKRIDPYKYTFWTNDKNLVEAFKATYFDTLWNDSIPLKDRVQQLKTRGKAINRVETHCGYCGEKTLAEYNYCPECGKKQS